MGHTTASWMITLPAVAGSILLVAAGFWELARDTPIGNILHHPRQHWQTLSIRQRMMVGNLLAWPTAIVLVVASDGSAWQWIAWLLGIALVLLMGWSIPMRPVQARKDAERALKRLTPSLINHLWIGLATGDPPMSVLRSYLARPDRRLAPMQHLIAETITLVDRERMLPFTALHEVTLRYPCVPLQDMAAILKQSEQEGSSPLDALARLRESVDRMIYEDFRLMLERRKMWLLLVTAFAVLAVVGQILFVAVVGSDALSVL